MKKVESTLYVHFCTIDLVKEEHDLLSKIDLVATNMEKENVFERETHEYVEASISSQKIPN